MKYILVLCMFLNGCAAVLNSGYDPKETYDQFYPTPQIIEDMGNLRIAIYDAFLVTEIPAFKDRCRDGLLETDGKYLVVHGGFQNYSLNDFDIITYMRVSDSKGRVIRQIDYDGYCEKPNALFDLLFEQHTSLYLTKEFQPIRNGKLLRGGIRYWGAIFELPIDSDELKFHINNMGNLVGFGGKTINLGKLIVDRIPRTPEQLEQKKETRNVGGGSSYSQWGICRRMVRSPP